METRVYLNDWNNYNNGGIGYGWMTTDQAKEFLENSNDDKEWFVADIDDYLGLLECSQFKNIDYCNVYTVIEAIELLEELEDNKRNNVFALMEYYNYDVEEAIENLDNYYFYENDKALFAEYDDMLLSECPEHIKSYIDWDKYHNDLLIEFYKADNGVIIVER